MEHLPTAAQEVADATDGIVLALRLAAGAARHRVGWEELAVRFRESSRLYPADADGNLRAMRVALDSLTDVERERYEDLVVFPPDTPIPRSTIERVWRHHGVQNPDALLARLEAGRLLDVDGEHVGFHDDQLYYLLCNASEQTTRHAELLNAHRPESGRWNDLPDDELYLWRHLPDHLVGAADHPALDDLATDLVWLVRLWHLHGYSGVVRALENLVDALPPDHRVHPLRTRIARIAHLVHADEPVGMIAATVASRLEREPRREELRQLAGPGHLAPILPLGGIDDRLLQVLSGHTGRVGAVGVVTGADGRLRIISGSDDSTVRVWDPDHPDHTLQVLTGHTGSVWAVGVMTGADGRPRIISGSHDRTVRVWDPDHPDHTPQVLTGHTGSVWAVGVMTGADGRPRIISGSHDRTVRVWDPDHPDHAPKSSPATPTG
ncbi:MAG: hypothetical protein R2715_21890 [Ilumatobacteraceae bacterium]